MMTINKLVQSRYSHHRNTDTETVPIREWPRGRGIFPHHRKRFRTRHTSTRTPLKRHLRQTDPTYFLLFHFYKCIFFCLMVANMLATSDARAILATQRTLSAFLKY